MWVWRSALPPSCRVPWPGPTASSGQCQWPLHGSPGISVTRGAHVSGSPAGRSLVPAVRTSRPARSEPFCVPRDVLMPAQPFLAVAAAGEGWGGPPRPGRPHALQPCVCPRRSAACCGRGQCCWPTTLSSRGARLSLEYVRGSSRFECSHFSSYLEYSKVVDGLEKVVWLGARAPRAALSPARVPATPALEGEAVSALGFLRAAAPRQPPAAEAVPLACPQHPPAPSRVGAGHLRRLPKTS